MPVAANICPSPIQNWSSRSSCEDIMPAPLAVEELPKSLQSLIACAKAAVSNWDVNEDADDSKMQAGHDWTVRLSRGEYEDYLYWECVAEDCEEAGDWSGAKSAYRRI